MAEKMTDDKLAAIRECVKTWDMVFPDDANALLAHVAAQAAELAALRDALQRYAEAWHQPCHPGHPAHQLMVSTDVQAQAFAALKQYRQLEQPASDGVLPPIVDWIEHG